MKAKKALLLIDFQKTFRDGSWGFSSNDVAEMNAARLLNKFRANGDTVIHVRHVSDDPSSRFYAKGAGVAFHDLLQPIEGENVISKSVNSAFINTYLAEILNNNGIQTLVIAGLTTPHCVSTTTRMAANLGYQTYLIEDATASFALSDHHGNMIPANEIQDISIATLNEEFAKILYTAEAMTIYDEIV
ncbi:cysteine hydrolase [Aerococcus agrisoli]|uniref:Cysteine hydrolase n=1 Tax=Aerococcus agrisoli TaxID=2487350 RepID=A0A3N4G5T9_9LACT|nr:cysteine hydrolase family protein [Aerococcus agrisoli]RPA58202.1 cysteine hydrolase [Aerococcus agrisoli]